jgi:hypothetical protein
MSVITTARPMIRSGSNRQALARTVFLWTSRVYAGAIFVQVFLAGMSLMGAGLSIQFHREFAHIFLLLGGIQLIALLLARFPRQIVLLTLGLAGLMVLQGALILLRPVSPVLTALHPVNALVILVTALVLIRLTDAELRDGDPATA